MTDIDHPPETLRREAFAWVARLTSGDATAQDAAALDGWRATSPAHRKAFAEAKLLWKVMRPAAEQALSQSEAVLPAARPAGTDRRLRRRAFLGGAAAASVAAVAGLAVHPPFAAWPSLAEWRSDYRTDTGEHRRITLADSAAVELNTRTSIALRPASSDADRIELIAGEAAIATGPSLPRPLVVLAGEGQAAARRATFNLRRAGAAVSVTCLDGAVLVQHRAAAVTLGPQQQVAYDENGLGQAVTIDPSLVTAWQRGLLVFRQAPLAQVIDEVNRYRPGRIILMNEALGRRLLFASFRIDRIEEVVPRLQAVFGMQVRHLPGGIVVLS